MGSKRLSMKITVIGLFAAVLICLSASAYYVYKEEYSGNELIKGKLASMDASYLYDYYVTKTPSIEGRHYYGSQNASVTIIAFLDAASKSSKEFVFNILPMAEKEFIAAGKARLYIKYSISRQDIAEKSDGFKYALYATCVGKIDKEKYYPFYFGMFNLSGAEELPLLAEKHEIPKKLMGTCMKEADIPEAKIDAYEADKFGISGIKPVFYIGLNGRANTILYGTHSYKKFKQVLTGRLYSIGE